jgi:lysophospholipase II
MNDQPTEVRDPPEKEMDTQPPFPEPHVLYPTSVHTHTVILLHGRGSNGEEFADEFFQGETFAELSLRGHFPDFKWVFPSARERFSTVFQDDLVEWFDIYSLTYPGEEEELQVEGVKESVGYIQSLIEKEAQEFGPSARDRIILGGISQGCAVAIITLLAGACGVGAFVGFNGWMPLVDRVKEGISIKSGVEGPECEGLALALRKSLGLEDDGSLQASSGSMADGSPARREEEHFHTPVLLSHTADDHVIDVALGKEMRDTLVGLGLHRVMWKQYETGGHWIPAPEGFEDVLEFLS